MVTVKIGKHTVELYDAIDELPIVRFHKYQKLLLVDAGVGADIAAFDQRIEKTRRFLMAGKAEQAQQELENLRQCVFMIQAEINPRNMAFAALVKSVDGVARDDISDEALRETLKMISDSPLKDIAARLEAVKKKIDGELMLYFPAIFNQSNVKEYFDILRKRSLAILDAIQSGNVDADGLIAVEELTTKLVTYSNPQVFSGADSAEIKYDRQFEDICLAMSEQLHTTPKNSTVLEFYNAYEFIIERAKQAKQAKAGANGRH